MEARERAVHLLTHYLTVVAEKAGLTLDQGDTRAEIGEAVDAIIQAAREPQQTEHERAVQKHRHEELRLHLAEATDRVEAANRNMAERRSPEELADIAANPDPRD